MRTYGQEKKKRKARASPEEYDRDGRWFRAFAARQEAWMVLEHWAEENQFRLTSMKGKRRLYTKPFGVPGLTLCVEMREKETDTTVTAWIEVSRTIRFLTLFIFPSEFVIEPGGWKGVEFRRRACSVLNSLLERLRLSRISGTDGWHFVDLSVSTQITLIYGFVCLCIYIAYNITSIELRAPDVWALTKQFLTPLGWLFGIVLALTALQWRVVVKKLEQPVARAAATFAILALMQVITVYISTRSQTEMLETKVISHCVQKRPGESCDAFLSKLTETQRKELRSRLLPLTEGLSRKSDR